jgi:hypothetical protein
MLMRRAADLRLQPRSSSAGGKVRQPNACSRHGLAVSSRSRNGGVNRLPLSLEPARPPRPILGRRRYDACGAGGELLILCRAAPHRRFRSAVIPRLAEPGLLMRPAMRGQGRTYIEQRVARLVQTSLGLSDGFPRNPRGQDHSQQGEAPDPLDFRQIHPLPRYVQWPHHIGDFGPPSNAAELLPSHFCLERNLSILRQPAHPSGICSSPRPAPFVRSVLR